MWVVSGSVLVEEGECGFDVIPCIFGGDGWVVRLARELFGGSFEVIVHPSLVEDIDIIIYFGCIDGCNGESAHISGGECAVLVELFGDRGSVDRMSVCDEGLDRIIDDAIRLGLYPVSGNAVG